MKAIRIDAKNKCIESVEFENPQLSDFYKSLECDIIATVYPQTEEPTNEIIYVDDEGLLKNTEDIPGAFFIDLFPVQPLFGHALIMGTTEDGDVTDTSFTIEQISDMVNFIDQEEIQLYQEHYNKPPQIFTF
jgi:hypothetical protein